jgi:MoaA/NifB/PqqE/SkfB family radical SAM enzyme
MRGVNVEACMLFSKYVLLARGMRLRKLLAQTSRAIRIGRGLIRGLADRDRPLIAHVVPMRRCNLSCAYCNEYDRVSEPVPTATMLRRLDRLAELRTVMVTISGGEPLMHPDVDAIIAHARRRGMIVAMITNGYYLSRERVHRLNAAGLDFLQVSIDNVEPDHTSMKSLRLLEPKLAWLAADADFGVNINSVIGSGLRRPADALTIAARARAMGFMRSVGIVHDGAGQLRPLSAEELEVYRGARRLQRWSLFGVNAAFQENLAHGRPNDWACRAGARYLYVDEGGRVHYCSQQRGTPGIPLEDYGRADIRREYDTPKPCAPFCTINCVQQVALIDRFRSSRQGQPIPVSYLFRDQATKGVLSTGPLVE